jgi:hypothetical protein
MTLKERVESYIGTVEDADTDALTTFLQQGAQTLVERMPIPMAINYTKRDSVTDGGLAITNARRVIQVEAGGVPANEIPVALTGLSTSATSILKRTALDPGYYIKDGFLFIVPTGLSARYAHSVPYPIVVYADEGITYFPGSLVPAVALYAAIQVLHKKLNDKRLEFTTLTVPSFTFTDAATITLGALTTFPTTMAALIAVLEGYLDTEEDIELAMAKLQEIQQQIANWRAQVDVELQKMLAQAGINKDIDQFNRTQQLAKQVQEYSARLQLSATEAQTITTQLSALMNQIKGLDSEYMRILSLTGMVKNDTPANG